MEKRPKPPTSHRCVQGPRKGGSWTREKSSRRPSWTELDARHGKQAKTTDEPPTRTRTQNGRYGDTGKKVPDARRGRNWTRAMENWAKPPTRHRCVHGPVHGPRTGGTWTREKSARRPSWTELDARHGKQAKTTDEPPTRTRTRTRTQTGRYGDTGKKVPDARRGRNWTRVMENWAKPPTRHRRAHGPVHGPRPGGTGTREKKCPTPVVDGTGRAPWKTGQNHRRGTDAYTDPYTDPERAVRGHGKKVPDARRGRNWTRVMENWAKPPTRHQRVHGPVHGPRPGGTGTREKSARRPSWTELDARHGKLGKTTDEAPTRTRTRTRTQNGRYGDTGKKCPTPVVDGTGRASWKTGQNHRRGTNAYTDPYTDPDRAVRGHGKKVPDARRGRNWTRAMENWAKPPTRHRRVHGPVHGPKNGYEGSGKKRPIRHGNRAKTS
jgi:hypothetical protein